MQLLRALAFFVTFLAATNAQDYEVPEAILMAYKPQGLHVSIPDGEGVELFAFHGNINKPMKNREAGRLSVDILEPKNGRWVFEDTRIRLKPGDKINYWLYVQVDGRGYPKDGLTWTVTELVDKNTVPVTPTQSPPNSCNSVTTVNGKQACSGQLIFEETFDSLESSKWQPAIQIGGDPGYPFVIYVNDTSNSFTADGNLNIKPTLIPEDQVLYGHVILNGCTGSNTNECEYRAGGPSILPPVYSAQVRTKHFFNFRYGRMEVRAKLPLGDWIFPEIQLKPTQNIYGSNPRLVSGQINIGISRGNRELLFANQDIGAKYLQSNCELSAQNIHMRENCSESSAGFWGDSFHVYGMKWTPDSITFNVDGREIGRVVPPSGGFRSLPAFSGISNTPWSNGGKMAPFDQEFYISLGVGVGGLSEFPDGSISTNNHPKPWKNGGAKSFLDFWLDRSNWFSTWSDNASRLQVDSIKVWAL